MSQEQGWSITWVIVLLIVLVAALGWCFVAGEYAKENEGWRAAGSDMVRGRTSLAAASIVAAISFAINGLQQLPNLFQVLQYAVLHRFWALVGTGVLISLLIAAGFGVKQLDQRLNKPYQRRR